MSKVALTTPPPKQPFHPSGESDRTPPLITLRAIILGLLTIAATFYYIIQIAQKQGSGTYVQSQYPMSAFMPFVLWLFANTALALIWPRLSLRRGEMLTLFCMTWVVAVTPMWINFWASLLSAPTYFADAENQWAETLFGYLPWDVFVPPSSRVIDNLWQGLPEGMPVPWDGWVGTVAQWLGVTGAATAFGYCLLIVFRHQWQENEKLPYPLAQLPQDLTAGFEQQRRLPQIFRSKLFWLGFAVVFLPQLHNIGTYFIPGLPTFGLFWQYYRYSFEHGLVYGFIRVMPLILMVVYLCPVHILGSIVIFHVLATFKQGLIRRYGAPDIGFGSTDSRLFLWTESHGALVFVGLWSIWIARGHLRQIWRQVRSGAGDRREVLSYRLALLGMVVSALYVVGWAVSIGVSLSMAVGSFTLMVLAYLVTVKLVAASGIAYIYPPRVYLKGEAFFLELVGSIYVPTRRLVPFKIFTSYAFLGHFTIPAWPAMAHLLRIFSLRRQPGWVTAAVLISFPVGFVVAFMGAAGPSLSRGRSDLPVAENHLGVRRSGPPDQQPHCAQPGQVGSVGGRFSRGGCPHPVAKPLSLVTSPSHRPDCSADPHGLVVLDQLPLDLDHQGIAPAFRRGEDLPGRQAVLLRAGDRLRHWSGALNGGGHDMVSDRRPPCALVVKRSDFLDPSTGNVFYTSQAQPKTITDLKNWFATYDRS